MAAAVCLMLLLSDELHTKIIIQSIKDVAVFHFLNLRNKICGTFRRICNSDEVLLHVSLRDNGHCGNGRCLMPVTNTSCAETHVK
jgi:hypothetical protein